MTEKIVTAIIAALAGGMLTWSMKAMQIEGRLDGIERAVMRIEQRLDK